MASVSSQPQFRYTQTPSKVLHLRNLPWECTEEELIELGKPFGKVVNTKCNVGANKNQAFIEFAEQNQAIAMISYYASSSEPAQVRGKTVYLQYSNRQEIVNNKTTADVAGNVLLVTIEGNDARLVSIDVLHLAHVKDISLMAAYRFGRKSACVFVSFLLCLALALSSLLPHHLPTLPF
ncbi:polypyrimidine tract-binding protein 2 [Actinidia rufa]|uniref:Polypyrimidine tract-binding protein 2 n=1 Tax=Actinidia rufa TaxID=165716 RepID=A0A7J0E601_9ERIC|nr:polypyrimidine tract-binding protein 2 [Actinidia rufa]